MTQCKPGREGWTAKAAVRGAGALTRWLLTAPGGRCVVACASANTPIDVAALATSPVREAEAIAPPRNVANQRFRAAAVGGCADEAIEVLAASVADGAGNTEAPEEVRPVLLFTGQGSQYVGMARDLYEGNATFREEMNHWALRLTQSGDRSPIDAMYAADTSEEDLADTFNAQRCLFMLQCSLSALWLRAGVNAGPLIGHSIGEVAAAFVAGNMAPAEAARLVHARAALMSALPRNGTMLAVRASELDVTACIGPGAADIAAVNGARNTVLSGGRAEIERAKQLLDRSALASEKLNVSHAFHSCLMEPAARELEQTLVGVRFNAPVLPLFSCLHGRPFRAGEVPDARYWADHTRRAVRFAAALDALQGGADQPFLEIGPQPVLTGLARRQLGRNRRWLWSLDPKLDDCRCMANAAAGLFEAGVDIRWQTVLDGSAPRRRTPEEVLGE
jgi:acyl transferase domain-containing protein